MELSFFEGAMVLLAVLGLVAVVYAYTTQRFDRMTALVALAVALFLPVIGSTAVIMMALRSRRKSESDLSHLVS